MVATSTVEREFRKINRRIGVDAKWGDEGVERVARLLEEVRLNVTKAEILRGTYSQTMKRELIIITPGLATTRNNPGKCQLFDMLPKCRPQAQQNPQISNTGGITLATTVRYNHHPQA